MPSRLLMAAVVGGTALAGAACSGSDAPSPPDARGPRPAETAEVESLLVATQRKASPEFHVGGATCPEEVPVREGTSFNCTVQVEGVDAPYVVTFADVNADSRTGRYDIRPAKAILSVPKLVAFVGSLGAEQNSRADCGPDRVRLADPGATFDCQLNDSRGAQTVTLRVDDVNGKVTVVRLGSG